MATLSETKLLLPDARLYIDGDLRDAEGGRTYDVISPWTGEVVGRAADASAQDVEAAIAAARRAFDETDWGSRENVDQRVELVTRLRDLFYANIDRLSDLARHEAGASLGSVGRAHVSGALLGWDDYLRVFPQVKWEKDYGARDYGPAGKH
ncbi:MAG: aldehyde dehydrogenase family protein, partial [Novosphingobium sp.]